MTPKNGYETAHSRTSRVRGKASSYLCISCSEQAKDWAYNHEEPDPDPLTDSRGRVYSNSPAFYVPMCRPCHRAFDILHGKPDCPQGHPYEGDNLTMSGNVKRCRECNRVNKRRYYQEKKKAT